MAAVAAPLRDDANQAEQEFLRLQLEAVREHIREHEDPDAAFARRLFLQDIQERLAELRQVRDHHAHHRPILAAPQNHRRMPVANFREHRQHIRAAQRQPPPGADVIDVDSLPDDDIQEVVTLDVGDEQAQKACRRRRQMELMNQQMGLLVGAEQGLQDAHGEMLGFLHRAPPLAAEPQRPRDAQAQEQYARDRQAPQAGALQVQLEHARRIRMQQNLQHAHIRRQLERLEPYVADNEIPGVQENPQHGEAGPAARGIPVLGQAQRQAQVVPPAPGTPRSEAYALPPLHRIDHHPRPLPVEPLAWREFGMPRDFLGVPGAAGDAARPARQANTVPPARVVNGPETVPAVAAGNGMPAQIRDIFHRQQQALGARNPNPRSVRAVRMGDLVELASRRPNHYVAGHGRDIGRIIPTREDYAARPQVVPDPVDGGAPAAAVGSNARPAAGPAPDIVDLVSDSETVTEGETDDDENALPLRSNVIDLTNDPEAVPKGGLRPRSRTRYLPNALAPVVPRNLAHPPWVRDRHVYLDSDEDDDTFLAPPAQRRRIVHEDPQDSDNERRERLGYFGADRNGNDSEREMGGQGAGAPARVVAGTRLPHDMDIW
ncbi:Hypothetical protein D9617_9g025770 [Elsinoe fawcettii]|nr:Hypothetical protein D9617_9g025770 [Elsinoe fawcettii]